MAGWLERRRLVGSVLAPAGRQIIARLQMQPLSWPGQSALAIHKSNRSLILATHLGRPPVLFAPARPLGPLQPVGRSAGFASLAGASFTASGCGWLAGSGTASKPFELAPAAAAANADCHLSNVSRAAFGGR